MDLQIELIEPRTLARSSDPSTSHEAAARVREFAWTQCEALQAAGLALGGLAGAEQVANACGLLPYEARKRLSDLEKQKRALPTDETRKTASGRSERVWRFFA